MKKISNVIPNTTYLVIIKKDHFCFHRPRPLEEASERYVTDVEVVGYAEKSNKFVSLIST